MYIAKPPLYKAKIGKREEYLVDEFAFKKFLFDWARENLTFNTDDRTLPSAEWAMLLDNITTYEAALDKLCCILFWFNEAISFNLYRCAKHKHKDVVIYSIHKVPI